MLSTAKTCSPAAGNSIFRQERGSSSAPFALLSVSNTVSWSPEQIAQIFPSSLHSAPSGMRRRTESPSLGRYFLTHPLLFPRRAPLRDSSCGESSGCSQKTLHANRRWRDAVVTGRGQEEVGCSRAAFRAHRDKVPSRPQASATAEQRSECFLRLNQFSLYGEQLKRCKCPRNVTLV